MKKFIVLAILAGIMSACGGGVGGNSPSAVIEKSIKAFQSGDFEKGLDFYIHDSNISDTEKKQAAEFIKYFWDSQKGIKSFEILNETIAEDGQSATVEVKYVYGNEKTTNKKESLKKVDGVWKIAMISNY